MLENGVNGWQFRDGGEFSAHLQEFLDDGALRASMAAAAAENARRDFSAEGFARHAAQVYAAAIEGEGLCQSA